MNMSIVIPVYNVEKYLTKCLDSLLPALGASDEVFLVQGDSTDKSRDISVCYQEKYPQITVLDQNGTGLSNARNCGLHAATGDYILFVDSDDFVDTAMFSGLLSRIRNDMSGTDVWVTNYYKHFETSGEEHLVGETDPQDTVGVSALPGGFKGRQCFWNVWKQCFWNVWKNAYRRIFLMEHKLFFKEGTYAEDVDFITRLLLTEPTIQRASFPFYHYRIGRTGSLMNEVPLKRVKDTVSVLEESICQLRNSGSQWAVPVISGFQFEYLLNLALLCEIDQMYQEEAQKSYKDYLEVLLPTTDSVVKACTVCMRLIGTKGMSRILWAAKSVKRKKEHRSL